MYKNIGEKYMVRHKLKKKFCWDERAELERLPLLLILLVIIAAIAIIIIFSWYSLINKPELSEIYVYIDGDLSDPPTTVEGTHEIYIIAEDEDGRPLKDVLIDITGAGINTSKKTGSNGKADFGSLTFEIGETGPEIIYIDALYKESFPIHKPMLVYKP